MTTITQELNVFFRPSEASWMSFPYVFTDVDMSGIDDLIFVAKITVSFENNIDTRAAQIDLIDKAIQKIDAEHYAKKTQLEARRNELLAIGCDSVGGE